MELQPIPDTYREWLEPCGANLVRVEGPNAMAEAVNPNSADFLGFPPADPHHMDYLGRVVPWVVTLPAELAGTEAECRSYAEELIEMSRAARHARFEIERAPRAADEMFGDRFDSPLTVHGRPCCYHGGEYVHGARTEAVEVILL